MNSKELIDIYRNNSRVKDIVAGLQAGTASRLHVTGLKGSALPMVAAAIHSITQGIHVLIIDDKEKAAYTFNDMEQLFDERELPFDKRRILFFPTAYRRPYEIEHTDNANVLSRTEVLNKVNNVGRNLVIVTYPEALSEKVVTKKVLKKNTFQLREGEEVSLDFLTDVLIEYGFDRVDFVVEPGQFAIRGGIVDLFSFSDEYPYRIEFSGDEAESIRTFNPVTQLSLQRLTRIAIMPDIQDRFSQEARETLIEYLPETSVFWLDDITYISERLDLEMDKARKVYEDLNRDIKHLAPGELLTSGKLLLRQLTERKLIQYGTKPAFESEVIGFNIKIQPTFNRNFDLLLTDLRHHTEKSYINILCAENQRQLTRLETIFKDLERDTPALQRIAYKSLNIGLHEGFVDEDIQLACYTDHQIFERYHRYRIREGFAGREAITLKELYNLKPGDYVTHIDHGIGRFDGMEIIENNGRQQEVIRLIYQNDDVLYVSIHSLHRIARFTGKDGTAPSLHKLGGTAWATQKSRTKQKVKDIARELIQLYAARKASNGFAYSPDTYMQHELEASFLYEDTPDQLKATQDVKADMEQLMPMDRLICGDVGFGKTEVALRAAFKAVADNKQVAILVPTTILALQHYKTFRDRLHDFPCRVDYINRFRSSQQLKGALKELSEGKTDIIIGTHRLLSKDVVFNDLGLLIVDEEQKFGVSSKEKLKQLRVNVDTLTLTATPIPRTLQFSLLGARDLSVINTAPPNRQPVQTEIRNFSEAVIRDAIRYEIGRGGQVFVVHNRVQNIMDVAGMIKRFVPDATVAIGHGQMEGKKLEQVMLDFIEGDSDVLVATTIIESGLDIPNVNTIIINDAHHYGLSELHQLRGRVGRSNKKAFCYLLSPPLSALTDEARRRLKSLEEFSDLGSGFNIAMRDLDIRGAGNLLGGEQSGFIADIGYEMYQKILDEAVTELKEKEFAGLYEETTTPKNSDCVFESDLEIMLPVDYVANMPERIALYKELDGITRDEELTEFSARLTDRFGALPQPALELVNTVRLRWLAASIGFERILLKNNRLTGYFPTDPQSSYYQSEHFGKVLKYIQVNASMCRMKEISGKLTLSFDGIMDVVSAIYILKQI
ncbi:MAG TPA: transcription-repair coupling factor [Bacteroidales bacterium]|nr:MAG: transcription-repair coupling factor [Bacteroidetes bacterium GWE2_42_24]OFY29891.1 MAG: transcription-repair coupling factor [Bacteroidetes bacterium GWF2_43_11]HBZ67233.1 transcription-repair coupling factor [Bacteroidales bacterium]